MNAEAGQRLIDIAEHAEEGAGMLHPKVVDGIVFGDLVEDLNEIPPDRHVVPGKLDGLVNEGEKAFSSIDLMDDLREIGDAVEQCFMEGITLDIHHFTVANGDLTGGIVLKDIGKGFDFPRQPDIILVTEKNQIAFRLICEVDEVAEETEPRRIPDNPQPVGKMVANGFDRLKRSIIGGIVTNQDFIRKTSLMKQTFELLNNVFFTVIDRYHNRYS